MASLEDELQKIVRAIDELAREKGSGWVSWYNVSRRVHGTSEYWEMCANYAELPEYRHYFNQTRNGKNVALSKDGRAYAENLGEPVIKDLLAPSSVADAIVAYAGMLHELHVPIEDLAVVAHAGGKVVQAVRFEMSDAQFATGTPVTVKPGEGISWTHGTIVGQDPESNTLYAAMRTEVPPEHLPAKLKIDRGFLLKTLADQVASLAEIPPLAQKLFGRSAAEQSLAVENAEVAANVLQDLDLPWARVLWGPPGAGKTFAIARFVASALANAPDRKFLLVAPSNLAVDVLLEELVDALGAVGRSDFIADRRLVRYGYAVKESILEQPEILGPESAEELANHISQLGRKLAAAERRHVSEEQLAKYRAEFLAAQEKLAAVVRDHVQAASVVATTTTSAYMPQSPIHETAFDYVLVDEASMSPPGMCYYLASLAGAGYLLAGDPRQLGPVVEQTENQNEVVQRWMGQDVFEAVRVSSGEGARRRLNLNAGALIRIEEQRRCPHEIWDLVADLYPQVRCPVTHDPAREQDGLDENRVLLLNTTGIARNPCKQHGKSWTNSETAELAVEVATAIVGSRVGETVAIICPYRAQARLLRRLLRQEQSVSDAALRIDAGTVHQFQGSAADTVIFDLVDAPPRSKPGRLLLDDTGLRLANVAITRARHRLIVLADRLWFRHKANKAGNELLWELIANRPEAEVRDVVPSEDRAEPSPYDSALEALLGDAIEGERDLRDVRPQYRIRRDDGTLISRADFAVPHLKYAIYVDGPEWHLTPRAWRRDNRLRSELRGDGWTVSVFPAATVTANVSGCVADIRATIEQLRSPSSG